MFSIPLNLKRKKQPDYFPSRVEKKSIIHKVKKQLYHKQQFLKRKKYIKTEKDNPLLGHPWIHTYASR